MAKCPKCGMEVATPKKTWKMAGKPDKSGKRTELTIGARRPIPHIFFLNFHLFTQD